MKFYVMNVCYLVQKTGIREKFTGIQDNWKVVGMVYLYVSIRSYGFHWMQMRHMLQALGLLQKGWSA